MQNITQAQAQNIVNTVTNNNTVTAAQIAHAMQNVKSTTFATVTQCSKVKTAAKHSAQNIFKITIQNLTLCNSASSIYSNSVNKHVQATQQAQAFTALASNYVMLNNSYSLCALKSNTSKHYLRAIVNKCLTSVYYCANTQQFLTKQQVAQYLTASAANKLLNTQQQTTVKHANITHNVTVRTFALQNIYSLNINKQQLQAA